MGDERTSDQMVLSGIDGSNPLGFLAALGALVTLQASGENGTRLRWLRREKWVPVLEGLSDPTGSAVSELVARGLRGADVPEDAERKRTEAQRRYEASKKAVEDRKNEIKKRRLKAKERDDAIEAEVQPLKRVRDADRDEWLVALAGAVPRPELALGKKIDCSRVEFREHALAFRARADRETLDLMAAFGSDGCLEERVDSIKATPFCFIKGGGHQYFLDTVRQLIQKVSATRVNRVLFESWTYEDETLSMRWDPGEDRQYALMDRDPTASDNKARTVWMANLLAYRALVLFPSAPRWGGLAVSAWTDVDGEPTFSWPIWDFAAGTDVIRSLVQLRELGKPEPHARSLKMRGVASVFRARRIRVGAGANFKLNFSPARGIL